MEMSTIMFAVANALAFYLHQVFKEPSNLIATKLWTSEIIQLALFGPDRKGQLQEGEALEYEIEVHSYLNNRYISLLFLYSCSNHLFVTLAIPQNDLYVRVLIFSLISELCEKAKEVKDVKNYVFDTLLITFLSSNLAESQKRYRAWTPHHQKEVIFILFNSLFQIRYWQTLCAFIPFIDLLEVSHVTSINDFIWEIIDVLHHRTGTYFLIGVYMVIQ